MTIFVQLILLVTWAEFHFQQPVFKIQLLYMEPTTHLFPDMDLPNLGIKNG